MFDFLRYLNFYVKNYNLEKFKFRFKIEYRKNSNLQTTNIDNILNPTFDKRYRSIHFNTIKLITQLHKVCSAERKCYVIHESETQKEKT